MTPPPLPAYVTESPLPGQVLNDDDDDDDDDRLTRGVDRDGCSERGGSTTPVHVAVAVRSE